MQTQMNITSWLLLILLSLLWGTSFVVAEIALESFLPSTLIFLRVFLAALALLLIAYIFNIEISTYFRRYWIQLAILGFFNNFVSFSLIVWGQTQINAGLSSILNAAMPIFTIILAHFWQSDERMSTTKITGIIVAIVGVITITATNNDDILSGTFIGKVAIIGACLSYAIGTNYARSLAKIPLFVIAIGQISFAAIFALPVMLISDKPWLLDLPDMTGILAAFWYAIISTALAYLVYFRILKTAGATNVSLVTLLIPVTTLLTASWILGEQITNIALLGMCAILFGLLLVDGRLFNQKPKT